MFIFSIDALANKYTNVRMEAAAVMGGNILEHKAKAILRRGEAFGKKIGLDALVNTLKDMLSNAEAVYKSVIKNDEYRDVTLEQIKRYYQEG